MLDAPSAQELPLAREKNSLGLTHPYEKVLKPWKVLKNKGHFPQEAPVGALCGTESVGEQVLGCVPCMTAPFPGTDAHRESCQRLPRWCFQKLHPNCS